MAENSNNSLEPLTEADKKLLDDVVLKFQVEVFALIRKFPNPEKGSELMMSSLLNREKDILLMISLIYLREKKDNDPFSPKDLIKFIKETLGETINPVFIEIVQQLQVVSNNLDCRSAREKILEKLENSNIIYNLSGIENYKKYLNRSPGRKSPYGIEENRGGRPSIYLFEKHIRDVKKALRKKDSIDYIHTELSKNSLLDTILLYFARHLFYIIRQNDRDFLKINYFTRFIVGRAVPEDYYNDLPYYSDKFRKLSNFELKQLTDYVVKNLKEDKYSLFTVVSLLGFFKL